MTTGMRRGLAQYGDAEFSLFLRKAFIKAMGYSDDALDRPIVGIANTYSDFNPCHGNVPQLDRGGEARRDAGRRLADGVPDDLARTSRSRFRPSMYLRNLMAMDTEEMIRAQPLDARGADRRLRQDDPRAADGRGVAPTCPRSSCRRGRC